MTDDDGRIQVCPYCNRSGIRKRLPGKMGNPRKDPDNAWWCRQCKRGFDDPNRRKRWTERGGNYGVSDDQIAAARRALGIDPDGGGADG